MSTKAVHLLIGRRAGDVELLPTAVAERLVEIGQARDATQREIELLERSHVDDDDDVEIETRDPKRRRR